MKNSISFILVITLIYTCVLPVYAQQNNDITLAVSAKYGRIIVSGKCGDSQTSISVAILKSGKTVSDMASAEIDTFSDIFEYAKVIESDDSGNFYDSIGLSNCNSGKYVVYVSSADSEKYTTVYLNGMRALYVSENVSDFTDKELTFRSIGEARDYISEHPVENCDTYVFIKGGEYKQDTELIFNSENSGSENSRIIYSNYNDEKVVLSGSKRLDIGAFTKVTDNDVIKRLHSEVPGKVVQINLAEQGITRDMIDFTSVFSSRNAGQNLRPPRFYLNNHEQSIARYPNVGYKPIIGAVEATSRIVDNNADYGGRLVTDFDEIGRWQTAAVKGNLFIEGFFGNNWHGEWAKISSVDEIEKSLTLSCSANYGLNPSNSIGWAAVNLLEEIDVPGEWYIEPDTMILYYYPPYELTRNDVFEITGMNRNLITVNNASYLTFKGLNFAKNGSDYSTRLDSTYGGNGIYLNQADNIIVRNCKFENIGMCGIYAIGTNIMIDSCKFYNTGFDGVCIAGGDRSTLTPSGNEIVNSQFDSPGRDTNSNQYGAVRILKDSVGCIVKNNVMHNMKNSAIRYLGNEHNISYNEIYNTNMMTADAGSIYTGRSFTSVGSSIMYNLFHDVGGLIENDTPYPKSAIYFDDMQAGNTAKKNIMYMNRSAKSTGIMFNGANYSTVYGNTIINSEISLWIGGVGSDSEYFDISRQRSTLLEIDYTREPYFSKYPYISILDSMTADGGEWIYQNNVNSNLSVNCGKMLISNANLSDVSKGNIVDESHILNDMSIFVDSSSYDFRITSAAKERYCLSDELLNEDNFDINSIGLTSKDDISDDMSFNLTYPCNNASDIDTDTVKLLWEKSQFADGYTYVVSNDSNFNNIVYQGDTYYNYAEIKGLQKGMKYYWYVTAKNISRQQSTKVLCGSVYSFKTSGISVESIAVKNDDGYIEYRVMNNTIGTVSYMIIKAIKDSKTNILLDANIISGELQPYETIGGVLENSISLLPSYTELYIWTPEFVPLAQKYTWDK